MNAPDARNLLATAQQLHRAGNLAGAMEACRQALAGEPRNVNAIHLLAMCRHQAGDSAAAIELMNQAAAIDPANAPLLNNLAGVYCAAGKLDLAVATAQKAIDLRPDYAEAYSNLGAALQKKREFSDAAVCLRQAIEFKPNLVALHINLAGILWESRRLEESVEAFQNAIKLAPSSVLSIVGLGQVLYKLGQYEKAEAQFLRAIQIDPQDARAHYGLAALRLSAGDFRAGLNEYEWRLRLPGFSPPRQFRQPLWNGADPAGKTILLQSEQGYGDAIQFARFVPMLAKQGAHVVLECAAPLKDLFQSLSGVARLISDGDSIPPFDVRLPLLSLPRVLGLTLQNIPADVPYLSAPVEAVAQWREKLAELTGRFKVGLVWAGSVLHPDDPERSWKLKSLAGLATVENIALINLQKGDYARPIRKSGLTLIDHTAALSDFAQTAALMENLDLVITVDTSVAHVAGAIAKPVWLMLPAVAEWRWLRERADSPWYPTLRLFRQGAGETQDAVAIRVIEELRTLVSTAKKSWGRRF